MNLSMMGKFQMNADLSVTCSCAYDGWMYVASKGIVYRTIDGVSYEEFWRTGSSSVTSMTAYDDAIFIGTSPDGLILFHNFLTGFRGVYVVTGDYAVSSMVNDGQNLYAATSPSGEIFRFDKDVWRKIYESSTDVSSLCLHSGGLYVFSRGYGGVPVFSSEKWSLMRNAGAIFLAGSIHQVVSTLQIADPNPETGFVSSVSMGGLLYFAGESKPVVYSYDGVNVAVVYRFGESPVFKMTASKTQVFVSVAGSVYVLENEAVPNA